MFFISIHLLCILGQLWSWPYNKSNNYWIIISSRVHQEFVKSSHTPLSSIMMTTQKVAWALDPIAYVVMPTTLPLLWWHHGINGGGDPWPHLKSASSFLTMCGLDICHFIDRPHDGISVTGALEFGIWRNEQFHIFSFHVLFSTLLVLWKYWWLRKKKFDV